MKPDWKLSACTVSDGPALARNNIPAFYNDPSTSWALLWPEGMELNFLIEQSAKRQARNLLRNREFLRHQKATDPDTGGVVGYARWVLPTGRFPTSNGDGRSTPPSCPCPWEEAQVPAVSADGEMRFTRQAEAAWWSPRGDMYGMDDEIHAVMERVIADAAYIKLDYLAVHPSKQGQGIATTLVKSGLQFADKHSVPVFTIAFKAARGIYARLGFREVARVVQDLARYGGFGEYTTYLMVRDAPGV
ncbi:hypothetical protein BDV06DRAFT_224602 [Aspergillus oleicola]